MKDYSSLSDVRPEVEILRLLRMRSDVYATVSVLELCKFSKSSGKFCAFDVVEYDVTSH